MGDFALLWKMPLTERCLRRPLSVPQVWPWVSSGDQCPVSPHLWRIKRDMAGWKEGEGETMLGTYQIQRVNALTIGMWLTCVCVCVCAYGLCGICMYVYSWIDGVLGGKSGVMSNLVSPAVLSPLTGGRWGHGACMSLGSAVPSLNFRRQIQC